MNKEKRHAALAPYLRDILEADDSVAIVAENRLTMGQSRAMFVLDLEYAKDGAAIQRKVVVRVEQWGHLGSDSENEVNIMRALHALDYPVAEILGYETSSDLLEQPFFVMGFVPGVSTFSEDTADEYIAALHRLHSIDATSDAFDFLETPGAPHGAALQQVERWYDTYRSHIVGESSPLVEEATQWLRNNAPENERVTLVHGDPGPGNYLYDDGHVTAVVDWEFIHKGDPYDDWAYLIAMRGVAYLQEDDWIARIEKITGSKIDRQRLEYWKAVNFLMGVGIDQTSHRIYADHQNPAPNLLAIATGVHLSALRRLCNAIFL